LAKAKRVFEIAKELGVTSKAIVSKCQAEGVPGITNHMSVVKIGLAVTITEWFSSEAAEEAPHTAVETAAPVDLEKARVPRRKRAAKKKATPKKEAPAEAVETPVKATVIAEPKQPEEAAPAPVEEKTPEEEAPKVAEPVAEVPEAPPAEPETPAEPEEVKPVGEVNVPERPKDIKPVGEKLEKPKEAALKGPRVVRVEQPERLEAPRPRRPMGNNGGGGGYQGGGGGQAPADVGVPGITRSRGPVRGRGAGGGGAGGGMQDGPTGRPNKRRSQSSRRGRSADAMPIGPGKMSEQDLIELDARLKGAPGFLKQRRRAMRSKGSNASAAPTPAQIGGKVEIAEPITIKSLSAETGIKSADVIKYLFGKGVMATINSAIDNEMAMEVAMEYNIELEVKERQTAEQAVLEEFEKLEEVDVKRRPPVVAVLGHVDHGKTSLLDRIRQEDVAAHEAGGITQHVGAYRVTIDGSDGNKKTVVFLDTPGHEAFTSMRARGANITDIVVLVVAADDGVMPQTIESINHAKAAGVTVVVALNKIDLAQATEENIHKIYGQLAEHGLNPTDWGGDVEIVKTSGTTGQGVADLLEILDYQAELAELQADHGGRARGMVIEAEMQEGRGSVARILVQQGTMRVGDFIVIGRAFGRVRDMTDDRGHAIKEAGPSTPLELSGIDILPDAGDKFYITDTLKKAEDVAKQYREAERQLQLASQTRVTLDNFAETIKAGTIKDLRVVLKADVQGSIDVLKKSLEELGNDEVAVRVLHAAVGGITESDVLLADASDAIVLGFHVGVTTAVRDIADERNVEVRLYRVIYDLTDDLKKGLEGLLEPEQREEQLGLAEVKEIFKISKLGNIAGMLVTEGAMVSTGMIRVLRDGVVVIDNREVESLRRVKDEVKEVRAGTECGLRIKGFEDIKAGDTIECYNRLTVARTLD